MQAPPPAVIGPDPCRDCGACCANVGSPPGYFETFAALEGERGLPRWLAMTRDWAIWRDMPEPLRDELRSYFRRLAESGESSRADEGLPCLWYDEATRRCRHYDHRPQTCREFEPGSDGCIGHRDLWGIPGPHPTPARDAG